MRPPHTMTAILPCNDLDASEAFYRRLGFAHPERPPAGAEDGYRILSDGKGGALHLTAAVEGWLIPGRNPFGLYLYTEDVDAIGPDLPARPSRQTDPNTSRGACTSFHCPIRTRRWSASAGRHA